MDQRLSRIHFEWIDASERTQATVRLLSEQLRRFLDDQVWLENRRVFDLLRSIEKQALDVRDAPPALVMQIDETAPTLSLPFERPLFSPPVNTPLDTSPVEDGDADFDTSKLHEQAYVDRETLARIVRRALQQASQVELQSIVEQVPLQQGLAELISYISLNDPTFSVVFDEEHESSIEWSGEDDTGRRAHLPRVTYAREADHSLRTERPL